MSTTSSISAPAADLSGADTGLAGVPVTDVSLKRRDFASDQEVRWCPGCGDYSILSTFQGCCPSSASRRRMPSSSRASAAPLGSPTT